MRKRRFRDGGRNLSNRTGEFQMGYLCAMIDIINELYLRAEKMESARATQILNAAADDIGHMKFWSKLSLTQKL